MDIKHKYEKTELKKLVEYYSRCWLDRLKSGLIDYSVVDDDFRSNSVIERYNGHIKDNLPRGSSWPKFLEFLKNEEASYVEEAFLAEQRGDVMEKSVKFGKTFLPKAVKKKIKKEKILDNPTVEQNFDEIEDTNSNSSKKRKRRTDKT